MSSGELLPSGLGDRNIGQSSEKLDLYSYYMCLWLKLLMGYPLDANNQLIVYT